MKETFKVCPFCAESIREEATKCRYCGEKLPPINKKIEEVNSEKDPSYINYLATFFVLVSIAVGTQLGIDGILGGAVVGAISGIIAGLIIKLGDKPTTKATALLLSLFLVIVAGSIFYQQRQSNAQSVKPSSINLLGLCLDSAESAYERNWQQACKNNAETVREGLLECLLLSDGAFCLSLWGTPDDSTDCKLPQEAATNIENRRIQDRDECYLNYR